MDQSTIKKLVHVADRSKSFMGYVLADSICCYLLNCHRDKILIVYEYDEENSYRDLLVLSPRDESEKVFIPAPLFLEECERDEARQGKMFPMRERGVHSRRFREGTSKEKENFWKTFLMTCNPDEVIIALNWLRPDGYEKCIKAIEDQQVFLYRFRGGVPDFFYRPRIQND